MKKIFILSAIAFSSVFFAQEAGKSGELLKNEASKSEMQTKKVIGSESKTNSNSIENKNGGFRGGNNNSVLDNSEHRNTNTNSTNKGNTSNKGNASNNGNIFNKGNNNTNKNYRWNYNYGYSEVFLRIPENGYFTVEVGDQLIGNTSGKFRFFDLGSGRIPLSIYENGYLLYRTTLNVQNNSRMVLDFFTDYGLYLLGNYPVQNQTYGFNEWDDVWNNPYNNGYGNNNPYNGYNNNNSYYGNTMNNSQFSQFIVALKKNSFDESKLAFVQQQARITSFSSSQIRAILKTFSFDDDRVNAAKVLYPNCVDKPNFYIVYDAFSFDSSRKELMQYISNFG